MAEKKKKSQKKYEKKRPHVSPVPSRASIVKAMEVITRAQEAGILFQTGVSPMWHRRLR
jgi:hypothetical protein